MGPPGESLWSAIRRPYCIPKKRTKLFYVPKSLRSALDWLHSGLGKKAFRYTVTSGVSFVVSQVSFVALFGTHLAGAKYSSISATLIGAVPSYVMNRYWAFEKKDSNSLFGEVVPYVIMALISLAFSTWATDFADSHKGMVSGSHLLTVAWVDGAYILSFAILWAVKFAFLNRILFAKRKVAPVLALADDSSDEEPERAS